MEEKEYLSEERYQKSNTKVNKTGKILLIVGAAVLVIGIVLLIIGGIGMGNTMIGGLGTVMDSAYDKMQDMANGAFGNFTLFAIGGTLCSLGFGLMVVGGIVILIGHRREIKAYATQQTMPIEKETIEKMAPTYGDAAQKIAKGIVTGIKEGLKDPEK